MQLLTDASDYTKELCVTENKVPQSTARAVVLKSCCWIIETARVLMLTSKIYLCCIREYIRNCRLYTFSSVYACQTILEYQRSRLIRKKCENVKKVVTTFPFFNILFFRARRVGL